MQIQARTLLFAVVLWLAPLAPGALASRVSLMWTPPTLNNDGTAITNLAGYRVRYGTESGFYALAQDVVGTNRVTISNLADDQRYFFVVTALAAGPVEGDASPEISWKAQIPAVPDVQACEVGPAGCAITWSVEENIRYEVQISSDLRVWTNAPSGAAPRAQGVQTAPTNGLLTYLDTSAWGHSKRFYRVNALSP